LADCSLCLTLSFSPCLSLSSIVHARGRKIVRISRRVNGLLLQLVVFELPTTGFEGPKLTEHQLLMKKVLEDEEKSKKGPETRSQLKKREKMVLAVAPPLRVIAYDPRTKFRDGVIIPPEAVLELAGGGYSPFLAPDKRRELGRVVCESLQLDLLRTGGFKLSVPWSGIKIAGRVKTTDLKMPRESLALTRSGKIFQNALRITRYNILVTAYACTNTNNTTESTSSPNDILFHFYSSTCSNEIEILISASVQREYMGQLLLSYLVGESRNIAITNFCKYFDAIIYSDPVNFKQKLLEVSLLSKKKGYVISYRDIGLPKPEEDLRSVGVPEVFMPPDATGVLLSRKSMRIYVLELDSLSPIEYVVSLFTKSLSETIERGVVVKVYSTVKSKTHVLHLGPNEVWRLCHNYRQRRDERDEDEEGDRVGDGEVADCGVRSGGDLIESIMALHGTVADEPKDTIEEGFLSLTAKGENIEKMKRLTSQFCDIIVQDIGIKRNSQGDESLYSRTSQYEPK
jgi:hypothetical protein